MRTFIRAEMAIDAGDLQLPGMLAMGERDRLYWFVALLVPRKVITVNS